MDSQYLIDQLNRHAGDYQTAFQDIAGWWGLAWFDGAELYLQAHGNEIALGLDSHGIWYYTSDWQHLESAVGRLMDFVVLEKGATVKFDCKHPTYTQTPDFHSLAPQGFTRKAVIWLEDRPEKDFWPEDRPEDRAAFNDAWDEYCDRW